MQIARHLWLGTMRLLAVAAISSGLLIGVAQVVHAAAPDAVTLTASPATSATVGTTVTFTTKVTYTGPLFPSGTVTFQFTGATTFTSDPVTLTQQDPDNYIASYPIATLASGAVQVVAHYSGRLNETGTVILDPTVSAPLNYTITPAPGNTVTATALTASANSVPSGSPLTLTATVTAGSSPVTTGTVTFTEGANTVASSISLDTNGIATYTSSAFTAGSHTVIATYSGDPTYAASTSSPLTFTIITVLGNTVTATALTASADPASSTSPFTLTATVTPASSPVPTGTVTFTEGTTTLTSVPVNGSGVAAYTSTGAFTAGNHTVIATYNGDSTYVTSASSPLTFTVTAIPTTTTGTALPSSVAGGFGLSLVVNVLPGGATIAGVSVDLRPIGLGPTPLANVTADTTWRKLVTVPATAPVGTFTLPVTLTDSASNPIIGTPLSVTIVQLVRSVSISPGNTQIIAGTTQPFTLTATYTDGTSGPVNTGVTWRVGSTQVATVDGTGHVTAGTAGSTLLIATYKEHSAQVTLTVVAGHGMPPAPQPLGTHAGATAAASTVIAPASAPATTHPSAPTPTSGAKPNPVPVRH